MPVNPKSIANLKPPKKGDPGRNPKGINGFSKWRDFAEKNLTEADMATILKRVSRTAKKGNMNAAFYLIDKIYGKTPEQHNINGNLKVDDITAKLVKRIKGEQP